MWDLASRRELTRLLGASDGVITAAFSPDGTRVVAVGRDSTVRVWDRGGTLRLALAGHTGVTWHAEFSHDGRRILTSADDGSARIWDAETGMPLAVLEGHGAAVLRARFSPDDAQVVTSSYDGTVVAWHWPAAALASGTRASDPIARLMVVDAIAWIAIACSARTRVWNAAGADLAPRISPARTSPPRDGPRDARERDPSYRCSKCLGPRARRDHVIRPILAIAAGADRVAVVDATHRRVRRIDRR